MTEHVRRLEESPGRGRLGRHVRHDERSRAYPFRAVEGQVTTTFHRRRVPIFDQGDLGSCVGNALAGALSTAPFHHRYHEATAVRFYKRITETDPWPGQYPPDDTGTDGLSACKWAQSQGLIGQYLHAFDVTSALSALQHQAVMVGITWLTGCDDPSKEGIVRYTGSVRGGHEICAVGHDIDRGLVWFANSWGPGWGVALPECSDDPGGYFAMSVEDFTKALADDGDVTVPQPVPVETSGVNITVPIADVAAAAFTGG